jgi:hypothetical protein
VAKSNERPVQQIMNSNLITGADYRVFEESVAEQKLAAYTLLKSLISDDEDLVIEFKRWFPVNLVPVCSLIRFL